MPITQSRREAVGRGYSSQCLADSLKTAAIENMWQANGPQDKPVPRACAGILASHSPGRVRGSAY